MGYTITIYYPLKNTCNPIITAFNLSMLFSFQLAQQ
ncbi:MAG: hypothetical protein ACFWT3_00495 [Pseudomonas lundensis]